MTSSSSLMHPVRLRIVQSLLGVPDGLTTQQMYERLTDVPIATLYRHVSHLVEHRLIEVVGERQARGASERTYRIAPGFANPTAQELRSAGKGELLTMFTVFSSGLAKDFESYLVDETADLAEDRVNFAQAEFWATNEEVDAFLAALMQALRPLMANEPGDGRRQRKLTTVLIPHPQVGDGPTRGPVEH
ncbi:helix-turn-helix domain-containing protein [Microbacterium murale]|uniref:DNA-binding transcriptional ArsR family regulator n=1 Tax=Microbacterium murale TaxID=1081040 RepID=A0ABU0PC31_9MICO|nr:helix-turn-helix domain-containing protein [Microbacterium murale]MDQ0644901.1 DNA-binding transcriptional ArsR family regulator [Microbacterium murale]